MLACMHRVSPSEAPSVVEFSSAVSNAERAHSLELFRKGTARVMVASDAATRGIDVEGVTAVVNYDPPVFPKTYVHRAGRTARAGKAGEVYTILRCVGWSDGTFRVAC